MRFILDKLKNNLPLNRTEERILQKEYATATWRIYATRFSILFFVGLQLMFLAVIMAKIHQNGGALLPPVGKRISVVPLDKPINDEYADKYISKITKLYNNHNVKSIVVMLRSPGGTPSASWRIADVISSLQKSNKKPVYMYVDSAAVSGSYMIASQSNKIYANPFSIVGSIGVIIDHLVFEELSKKIGFKEETLTTGKYKKVLSTFSELNEEQKEYLKNNLLNSTLDNFVKFVAKGRNVPEEKIRKIADGSIFVATDDRIKDILVDKVINWSNFKEFVYDNSKISKDIDFKFDYVDREEAGLFSLFGTANFNLSPEISNNLLNRIK